MKKKALPALVFTLLAITFAAWVYTRPAPRLLVTDGNSLTDGKYSVYPKETRRLLGGNWDLVNVGLSGCTTQHMLDHAQEVDALRLQHDRARTVLVAWEISNDLALGASRDDAYARFVRYCRERKRAGWTVLALTVLPRTALGSMALPDTFEIDRIAIDERMRREWPTFADGIVDVAADDRIGTFGRQLDKSLYYDGVHLTPKGYGLVAQDVVAVIPR
jgi:lysophospholipase L1-like esterase